MPSILSVGDWKKLVKEHPEAAKADALLTALKEYEKAESNHDQESLLETIETVIDKAEGAKKSVKKKEVVTYLDKMIKEAEAERKSIEQEIKKKESEDDDDKEKPGEKLLKTQLRRALKCKRDEPRPFVVALGKISGLVLAKGPTIGGEHKKMARATRVGNGKLLIGNCYGESGKYVFEFAIAPPGGLAKALKKAALFQAEMKIKVIVRGPEVELDDETDLDEIADLGTDTEDQDEPSSEPTSAEPTTTASTTEGDANATATGVASEEEAKWEKAHADILEEYLEALRTRQADAGKLRALMGFAEGKAEAKEFGKAIQSLESLEKILHAKSGTNGNAAAGLQQWQAACAEVKSQLRQLETAILKSNATKATEAVVRLESIVKNLTHNPTNQQSVAELERYLGEDDVITRSELPNPWGIQVNVRGKLLGVLSTLKPQLPA